MPKKSRNEKDVFEGDFQSGFVLGTIAGGEFREAVFERDGEVSDVFDLNVRFPGGSLVKLGVFHNQDGSEDWKWKKIWREAGVEPQAIPESDDAIYDENDLTGHDLLCMVYQKPDSEYMDIFDVLAKDADEKRQAKLDERFRKFWDKKFGKKQSNGKAPARGRAAGKGKPTTKPTKPKKDDSPF